MAEYHALYDEAKQAIVAAKDVAHIALIESVDQLGSPCSDRDEGKNLGDLLDGNGSTFWHSDWHGDFTLEDHHYLQVELLETMNEPISMYFKRRDTTSGNQINKWSVWGTNEDDFELTRDDEGFEKLADLETPYHSGNYTETLTSLPFETKGYKYLRFYCEGTCNNDGSQGGNTKFFHISTDM